MNISKTLLVASTSIILAVALVACNKPGPAEKAGKAIDNAAEKTGDKMSETSSTLGKESDKAGVALDDTAITAKVKAAILAEPGLKVLQIAVDTIRGETTLSGSVDSQHNSDRAKEITGAVAGVKRVENKLVVKSPS